MCQQAINGEGKKMKGCIVFLVLVGSLAAAADLKVTITNARGTPLNANAPAVSAIDFDSDLSVDTGFTQQTIYTSGSNQRIEFAAMPGVFLHELAGLNHGGSYPLDPALFKVPPDFKKVKELYQRNGNGTWTKTKAH
jgi:hypothetical protein